MLSPKPAVAHSIMNASRRLFSVSPARPLPSLEIQLTEKESELCTLLDECAKSIHEARPEIPPVECRIAGGWVRDKLLGLDSNDIDVALSTMMGVTFAEHLVRFMSEKGHIMRGATTIARNPDQSKHLETAMVNVLGLDIDLVNLRSEVYAEGSRIPSEVMFGSPTEDALRRDTTINALFYNVHTRSVEDFTGKGLEDLKNGIIRTPLAPRETFLDDPLRVLRCIRFASRYGYQIEASSRNAMQDPEIQAAVRSKISRERVGVEMDKMLKARNPLLSLEMIDSLHLHDSVFWLPPAMASSLSGPPAARSRGLVAAGILQSILRHIVAADSTVSGKRPRYRYELPQTHPALLTHASDPNVQRRLFLAAALTPFRNITLPDKRRTVPASEVVIREGLKLGTQNHYMDGIPALFEASVRLSRPTLDRFDPSLSADRNATTMRSAIGLALKDKSVHNSNTGAHWSSSLLFSLVQDLMSTWNEASERIEVNSAKELIEIYNVFLSKVEELDIPSALNAKPLLDGKEVCAALSIRPGAQTGVVLSRVVEWQLSHPDKGKTECEAFLKEELAAGRLLAIVSSSDRRDANQRGRAAKKAKKE